MREMSDRQRPDGNATTEPFRRVSADLLAAALETEGPDGVRRPAYLGLEAIAVAAARVLIVAAGIGAWPLLPVSPAASGRPPPACVAGSSTPSGTVSIAWTASHAVSITFNLTGMSPSCQYAVGLLGTECQSRGSLLAGFPAATASAGGTDRQTLTSTSTLGGGVPAHSSIRLGTPGSSDPASAANAVACANVQQTIDAGNPTFQTHIG
jgi:hypothetical protein